MNNYESSKQRALLVSTYLPEYLKIKGKEISKNNTYHCLNPTHYDKHPSMHLFKGRDGKLRLKCQSCGDVLDIFNAVERLDRIRGFKNQYVYLCKLFNLDSKMPIPHSNYINYPKINCTEQTKKYLNMVIKSPILMQRWKLRGILPNIIQQYNLGFDDDKEAYVIPIGVNGYIQRFLGNQSPKYKKSKGLNTFFMTTTLDNNLPLIITEGEIDALSILQCGYPNVLSLGGVSNLHTIYKGISKSFHLPLILALDIDHIMDPRI